MFVKCLIAILFLLTPLFSAPPSRFVGWVPGDHCECPDDKPYCYHLPGYFEPVRCLPEPLDGEERLETLALVIVLVGMAISIFVLSIILFGFWFIIFCRLNRRPHHSTPKETKEEETPMSEVELHLDKNICFTDGSGFTGVSIHQSGAPSHQSL